MVLANVPGSPSSGAPGIPAASAIALVSFNQVPQHNPSFKYERLGPMALTNHRQYAVRNGYAFFPDSPGLSDSPACWEKIPAILHALKSYRWVLWADSDALVANPDIRLEDFCDPAYDLVVQCPRTYFQRIGLDIGSGLAAQPINSGVFMVQATPWSRQFLQAAYALKPRPDHHSFWDGIGEQEAMIKVLKCLPAGLTHIRYVDGLQSHPLLHGPGKLFVHFYGNQASHLIPPEPCEEVLLRWERAVAGGGRLPKDMARFHWCCIQNKQPGEVIDRGGPERFLYVPQDIQRAA